MKVLYISWDSCAREDIPEALGDFGFGVEEYWIDARKNTLGDQKLKAEILRLIRRENFAFVFSWNFFPIVSEACGEAGMKYASWVYDSPLRSLWHPEAGQPWNYIFIFDAEDYLELSQRLETVYYLPLAANAAQFDRYRQEEIPELYQVPVSFVGSTYMESRYSGYQNLQQLEPYQKGYVEGMMKAQQMVYGTYVLEELMEPALIEGLKQIHPMGISEEEHYQYEKHMAQVVLARYITALERKDILSLLSEKYPVYLYTKKKTLWLPRIINRGRAGSRKESCFIFSSSKINLNMTLRSIRTGIPLRALEIMAAGGFLLTNYQSEFLQYFEPDVDFVYYESYEDLLKKVDYYLSHEEERAQIAQSGYEKVKAYHSYANRFEVILQTMGIRS